MSDATDTTGQWVVPLWGAAGVMHFDAGNEKAACGSALPFFRIAGAWFNRCAACAVITTDAKPDQVTQEEG